MKISIIVPAKNESRQITRALASLQSLRAGGHEIIVVDGESEDNTAALAGPLSDVVLSSPPWRAKQMNVGASAASGDVFLFLHADTLVPNDLDRLIIDGMHSQCKYWGRFDVRLDGRHPLLRIVEFMMNWRSRLSGIATGDQGIFVERQLFQHLGGFSEIPLMEDIDLSRRLKCSAGAPLCLKEKVCTSSRRWEQNGIVRTILLMWYLRAAYYFGVAPERLAQLYRGT